MLDTNKNMADFVKALKNLVKSAETFANQRFGPYGFYICIAAVVLVLVMAIVVPVAIVASNQEDQQVSSTASNQDEEEEEKKEEGQEEEEEEEEDEEEEEKEKEKEEEVLGNAVDPYPDVITVTWRNSDGSALITPYIPEQGVYTRTGASLDGSLFNTDFMEAFGNLTCYQVYQYSETFAFVKYSDDTGINRFALLAIIGSSSIKVSTAEDVGVSKDPSTYVGAWDYSLNGLATLFALYLDVSSIYY